MGKQTIVFILFSAFFARSYGQVKVERQINKTVEIDTSVIAILSFETNKWAFDSGEPTSLTFQDLTKTEAILKKCIDKYNSDLKKWLLKTNGKQSRHTLQIENFGIDLKKYKRQYLAITNSKGEKEIWINGFCDTLQKDWRKELIVVHDGGNCFFNLKINLATRKYYSLQVNGSA